MFLPRDVEYPDYFKNSTIEYHEIDWEKCRHNRQCSLSVLFAVVFWLLFLAFVLFVCYKLLRFIVFLPVKTVALCRRIGKFCTTCQRSSNSTYLPVAADDAGADPVVMDNIEPKRPHSPTLAGASSSDRPPAYNDLGRV